MSATTRDNSTTGSAEESERERERDNLFNSLMLIHLMQVYSSLCCHSTAFLACFSRRATRTEQQKKESRVRGRKEVDVPQEARRHVKTGKTRCPILSPTVQLHCCLQASLAVFLTLFACFCLLLSLVVSLIMFRAPRVESRDKKEEEKRKRQQRGKEGKRLKQRGKEGARKKGKQEAEHKESEETSTR